ncbi:MAG: glycoside hydrolase TIM-barrel-like domain-containing protein, partial [Alphaproteobacteria bacterium]
IIWSMPLKEIPVTQTYTQKGKGVKSSHTYTEYTYYASFAVAICEGKIEEIVRVYAGTTQLDLQKYTVRIYKGTDSQLPDPFIESIEGVSKTPAYRNLAYVVFENISLAEFGNHIPNLNFEVRKKSISSYEKPTEDLIKSVCLIPGSGEFVYDTVAQTKSRGDFLRGAWAQRGVKQYINKHTLHNKTNSSVALDNLQNTLNNVEWVSVVITWFGNSLDIKNCTILPGAEYSDNGTATSPDKWKVSKYYRSTAHQITKKDGRPVYGGSINDASLVRFVKDIKARNLKVMLYPMIFIDMESKPWRGFISGKTEHVKSFFNKPDGYNQFITHYASLLKDDLDGIIIGSEMKALTQLQDEKQNFPAVDELINLAHDVKSIVPSHTVVTYSADWSEYHHAENGYYHLDKLWASKYIDVVGIDSYFPLTNSLESTYDYQTLKKGWESGEGYEFYYEDSAKNISKSLDPKYAWKNIKWWWENEHINPDGSKTDWQPKMKKIWFTEYGFPSVDCCSNQPNVFFDGESVESGFPIHSRGQNDFKAQRSAIHATEEYWANSEFVERLFLWSWDARPYPYWPDLSNVWSDYTSWEKGHWVQGKIGKSTLIAVLEDLCLKSKLDFKYFAFENLQDNLDGLVIDSQTSAKKIIDLLSKTYLFDLYEHNAKILFTKKHSDTNALISAADVLDISSNFEATKHSDSDLPYKVDVNFIDLHSNYNISNHHTQIECDSNKSVSLDIPIVMCKNNADIISKSILSDLWNSNITFKLHLGPQYQYLKPTDLIDIKLKNKSFKAKISSIHFGKNYTVKITAESYKERILNQMYSYQSYNNKNVPEVIEVGCEILDLPYFGRSDMDKPIIYIATYSLGTKFKSCDIYYSTYQNTDFDLLCRSFKESTYGHAISEFKTSSSRFVDNANQITINLISGELESIPNEDLIKGKNLCVIGNEIIQFKNAVLVDENQYVLTELYRGLYCTEQYINSHTENERFVLLDSNIIDVEIPEEMLKTEAYIKAVSPDKSCYEYNVMKIILEGNHSKPYAPIDLKQQNNQITWCRRSRVNNFFGDYDDVPLDSKDERYLVSYTLIDGSTQSQIVQSENINLKSNCESIRVSQISSNNTLGFESHTI